MSLKTLLQKDPRTGVYYFRQRVPSDLLELIGKKELKQSLRTKDPKQGKRLATLAELEAHRLFDSLRYPNALPYEHDSNNSMLRLVPLVTPMLSTVSSVKQAPLLSHMLERWKKERTPSVSAISEWAVAIRRFIELHGDLPIDKITKDHIRSFKDALMELPKRLPHAYRKHSLPKLIALSNEGKLGQGKLANATINKLLSGIKSLLSLAVQDGFIETNVAIGIRLQEATHNDETRVPYDLEDIKLLFTSPNYSGHKSDRQRHLQGTLKPKDAKFWLPLIGLFTGARLEEIGQSLVSDVRQDKGIWYLSINAEADGKSLKTASSKRNIPLHRELIACGFLEYVQQLKDNGNTRLFPELNPSRGNYTKAFSQWYGRYANYIGITDKRKVFHSFRHTFKDAMREAGVDEAISDAATGHSSPSIGRRYGSGYSLGILNEAMQKVSYEGLDLSHLYP